MTIPRGFEGIYTKISKHRNQLKEKIERIDQLEKTIVEICGLLSRLYDTDVIPRMLPGDAEGLKQIDKIKAEFGKDGE